MWISMLTGSEYMDELYKGKPLKCYEMFRMTCTNSFGGQVELTWLFEGWVGWGECHPGGSHVIVHTWAQHPLQMCCR